MPPFVDLTGRRFGCLVVIGPPSRRNTQVYWPCRCDCGTEKLVQRCHLRSGGVRSCGRGCLGRQYEYGNESLTLTQLAARTGIARHVLYYRLVAQGWTVDRAVAS